jgi:hypothetical protein
MEVAVEEELCSWNRNENEDEKNDDIAIRRCCCWNLLHDNCNPIIAIAIVIGAPPQPPTLMVLCCVGDNPLLETENVSLTQSELLVCLSHQ